MNSQIDNKKKFYIHTLGCKVNQYESQAMRELLLGSGFQESNSKNAADIYIVNTCTVTHHADRQSRYFVNLCRRMNPDAQILVAGCFVENNGHDAALMPGTVRIVRNEEKGRIAEILNERKAKDEGRKIGDFSFLKITDFKGLSKAYVKIQDGCDNHCSYCKVPLVRSRLSSKPINDIVEEVGGLVNNGFKEIVLTGICLGAWGKDLFGEDIARRSDSGSVTLLDALKAIDKLPGDFRVRLSSIEPRYVTEELIDFMAGNKRMCRHLHIPLQSGDDEILKKMNRPYTQDGYRRPVDMARAKIEGVAITTDVLVGFPGESDNNFNNTLAFVKEMAPSRTHIFTYSRREFTPASSLGGELGADILKKRYDGLKAAAFEVSCEYRKGFLGKELNVLVETKRDASSGLLKGYSDNYIKVFFNGPDNIMKKVVRVKIKEVNAARTLGVYE